MGQDETKVCSRCGEEYSIFFFYSRGIGRRDYMCRYCRRAEEKKRRANAKKKGLQFRVPSICWKCKNAVGGCSWSAADNDKPGRPIKFEPVPGWTAIQTAGNKGRSSESFLVLRCPKFEPDERRDAGE